MGPFECKFTQSMISDINFRHTLITLFSLTLFFFISILYSQNPIEQIVVEDDWSLPYWVDPSYNSGLIFYDYIYHDYPGEYKDISTVGYRWRDLNPDEGVYDWSDIEEDLADTEIMYIRIMLTDTIHVPQWLFHKYPELHEKAFLMHEYNDFFEENSEGYFVPFWHAGVKEEMHQFFNAFKEQGYASNPKIHHMYIPGAYTWGEFSRAPDEILERDGLTPETYVNEFKDLIDMFADAFENFEYKLVYTGYDILENDSGEYWRDGVGRKPSKYVVKKGLGYRTGMLEKFNFVNTEFPNYGHNLSIQNGKNYIVTDDFNPMIADSNRVTANENEAFCYGDYPCDYYHIKMSVLKQLQMRHRFSYTNHHAYEIDDAIHHYFFLTAGKQYYDSPDAWCALRDAKDIYQWWTHYPDREDFYYSNWERWLYQRDVESDGKTQRAYYIDDEPYWTLNGDAFEARSTIVKDGQNYIYFNVDDKFMYRGPYEIEIKVTYLDNFDGQWQLQYQNKDEDYAAIDMTNSNDNQWKTATFKIDDDYFTNGLAGGNDFRLFNGGEHDLTVRFVRTIKTKDPSLTTAVKKAEAGEEYIIYPNPTQGYLNLSLSANALEKSLSIYDIYGKHIKTQSIQPAESHVQIHIDDLAPGVYILIIGPESKKFVKY